ncbi:MAG TPA: FAD-dependent oxidoreductase [Chthoniobacteraceae bacterium]|jgi:hypothetical protein|nr:FAD-dependent oxidoreductase [Chthoniobacteraceae bacterium]
MSSLVQSLKSRREFLALSGGLIAGAMLSGKVRAAQPDGSMILLEAEEFDQLGGWVVDQQSMEQMGSSYVLAHGLGIPVQDAVTRATVPAPGLYRLWVRTRDWVAPWKAPGAPGKFQVVINGKPVETIFGTEGADWHWQDGGLVALAGEVNVALHDLTGFEGRCDALLFCKDGAFQPPNDLAGLDRMRRELEGLPDEADDGGMYDLVVAGGGIAGTCAALSAARNGLTVALVQDRPVLGGNGSSEVRVWPEGHVNLQPYPGIGDIVKELVPAGNAGNARSGASYGDNQKINAVHAEPRIRLLTEQRVRWVETTGDLISAVVAQHTRTGRRIRLRAKFFADCTGDATVGYLAGANYEETKSGHQGMSNLWNILDAGDSKQVLKCECQDKTALAHACEAGNVAQPFPRCPWAIDLSNKPFPGRKKAAGKAPPTGALGQWFWESGFEMDPVTDVERIRDLNLRAMYGAWDALKNVDKLYPNYRIGWAAYIAGKRESRRLMGDVVLGPDDFHKSTVYEDACFPCTWPIDLHSADPHYSKGLTGEEFISQATVSDKSYRYNGPYWAPYRCLYSRNIGNLFMAGRDISVSHDGLGPVRVMKTCGMMGEIVGKAAAICVKKGTTPRGVYEQELATLKEMMGRAGAWRES